jgi:phosphoglycerate dehydrogenase-like enzyme
MRVLVLDTDYTSYEKLLAELSLPLDVTASDDPAAVTHLAGECRAWLGAPDLIARLLPQVKAPDWVQSSWSGITPLLAPGLPRNYRLARAVDVFGQFIGEFVLSYLLAHERRLFERAALQQARQWNGREPGTLAGRHLLMVGCGNIGVAIGRFLEPFNMVLSGVARTPRHIPPFGDVRGLKDLARSVATADYVISLLPDTSETRDLYDAAMFASFKQGAVFMNVGRGPAVVDEDLVASLRNGHLGGAVLDVCRQEPLPADHPFWTTDNLILTGHTAGPSAPEGVTSLFATNLALHQAGQALRGQIDFNAEY